MIFFSKPLPLFTISAPQFNYKSLGSGSAEIIGKQDLFQAPPGLKTVVADPSHPSRSHSTFPSAASKGSAASPPLTPQLL